MRATVQLDIRVETSETTQGCAEPLSGLDLKALVCPPPTPSFQYRAYSDTANPAYNKTHKITSTSVNGAQLHLRCNAV